MILTAINSQSSMMSASGPENTSFMLSFAIWIHLGTQRKRKGSNLRIKLEMRVKRQMLIIFSWKTNYLITNGIALREKKPCDVTLKRFNI